MMGDKVKRSEDTETDHQLRLPRHRIRRVSTTQLGGGEGTKTGGEGAVEAAASGKREERKYGRADGVRARPRQRALKLVGSTGRGGCIPSLTLRPVNSTKPIALDTLKAPHRRLEWFLNHPLLPSPSSPTFHNSNRGAHASVLILSLHHTRNSRTMFSGFLTVLFLQDFGDKTQTPLPSFRSHQWDRNQTVPRRQRGLLVPSCPSIDESSAVVNHAAFPIEHRSPSDRASADESQIYFAVFSC
ncbi:hypothetical protein EDB83DRAFT_315397 [Lactarius deliciosus]|nr:hypothetical protein EDB83DRAFT_315397 [Lactarius deliciosus]